MLTICARKRKKFYGKILHLCFTADMKQGGKRKQTKSNWERRVFLHK